jgi:hypothetical protein
LPKEYKPHNGNSKKLGTAIAGKEKSSIFAAK